MMLPRLIWRALSVLAVVVGLVPDPAEAGGPEWARAYNVVWTNQSRDSLGSMPCGAGNIGLNVWVENSDLLILIGSPDSWWERGTPPEGTQRQGKLGRLRISFSPNVMARDFRQELDLEHNCIDIGGCDADGKAMKVRVWVDAFRPVVHVEGTADRPVDVAAAMETWRGEGRHDGDTVEWFWRNSDDPTNSSRLAYLRHRKLEPLADVVPDLLRTLTFGGRLGGAGFVPDGVGEGKYGPRAFRSWKLRSSSAVKAFALRASLRIAQDATPDQWRAEVGKLDESTRDTAKKDWSKTEDWWKAFWGRSHIIISDCRLPNDDLKAKRAEVGDQKSGASQSSSPAWQVGRNYQLFRAMLASNSSGRFPTLFNGGHFTCEADPEARHWDWSEFMAQNQRLVYWPMLKSGDADLLKIALDFYAERAPVAAAWAKHFWGIEGGLFTEDMNIFGMPCYTITPDGHSSPACLPYHYVSGMEFALMMLEYGRYTGADIGRYLPAVEGILRGYDQFYRKENKKNTGSELDPDGRLVIFPSNSTEVYAGCKNDSATLAGLMALADGLLALPEGLLPADRRAFVCGFRDRLAPIPRREIRGHKTISPAQSWTYERPDNNMEFPHLYPVFPFGYYGVGKPDLELARDTWRYGYYMERFQKRSFCWYQGNIFTARLGLTGEAKKYALAKFLYPSTESDRTPGTRYPAFWDTFGFCQRPDFDHGGSAMVGLQEMLLQADLPATDGDGGMRGRKIYLLPAWPKEWDVDFKLHAPYQTTVECVFCNGKVKKLKVTPRARAKDVVDMSQVEAPKSPVEELGKNLCEGKPARASSQWSAEYGPEKAVDGSPATRWATAAGQSTGWIEIDLGTEQRIGRALVSEIDFALIRKFALEIKDGETWKALTHGTTLGPDAILKFAPVTARHVRLNVLEVESSGPNINEFQLFAP